MNQFIFFAVVISVLTFATDSLTKGIDKQSDKKLDVTTYETDLQEAVDLLEKLEDALSIESNARIYESKIKEAIRKLMEQLRHEGIPSLNISSIDPFIISNLHFEIDNNSVQVKLDLDNGDVRGVTYFDIPKLSLSLIGLKFMYGFQWPSVRARGVYKLDGSYGQVASFFGNGNFDLEAKNLIVEGAGKLGSDENHFIHLENFSIFVSMEEFKANITGFMNDPELSRIISTQLSVGVPAVLDELREDINQTLSTKVIDLAETYLKNKTLSDIINGLGRF